MRGYVESKRISRYPIHTEEIKGHGLLSSGPIRDIRGVETQWGAAVKEQNSAKSHVI